MNKVRYRCNGAEIVAPGPLYKKGGHEKDARHSKQVGATCEAQWNSENFIVHLHGIPEIEGKDDGYPGDTPLDPCRHVIDSSCEAGLSSPHQSEPILDTAKRAYPGAIDVLAGYQEDQKESRNKDIPVNIYAIN